jgi:DNA-binding GntR family transcriptional regulator
MMLKDRAFEEIKALIQTGQITSESTLSERHLAARLGMSKTPIRAALENLESQGLVTVSPQRGIFVRELSAREIAELFDVRMAVESVIAVQLARSALTTSQQEAIKANLRLQAAAAESEDFLAATELDVAFHRLLAALLDNREMMTWLERCFDRLHRSILQVNRLAPGRLPESKKDHDGIAKAIIKGLPEDAARLMKDHLSFGRRFLLVGGADRGREF